MRNETFIIENSEDPAWTPIVRYLWKKSISHLSSGRPNRGALAFLTIHEEQSRVREDVNWLCQFRGHGERYTSRNPVYSSGYVTARSLEWMPVTIRNAASWSRNWLTVPVARHSLAVKTMIPSFIRRWYRTGAANYGHVVEPRVNAATLCWLNAGFRSNWIRL